LPRRENGSRHLVEQRHEHVVIVAVDQDHLDRRPAERLGRRQPAEASADNDNAW